MIKHIVLNIINRFIKNKLLLGDNGFYSFFDIIDKQKDNTSKIFNINCLNIIEEVLQEEKYLKKDEKISKDTLYELIVELENLTSESVILLMASLKNFEQHQSEIDKLNSLLINKFNTNDIDFYIDKLLDFFRNKKIDLTQIDYFLNNINDFKTLLCFLTDTPYNIETPVGIFNNILIDDNINTSKVYKIKQKKNSLELKVPKNPKCDHTFYTYPGSNPVRMLQSPDVFLKEGWERITLKDRPVEGLTYQLVNGFHSALMIFLKQNHKALQEVYFENEAMCQRRWTNYDIQDFDEEEAFYDDEEYTNPGQEVYKLYDPEYSPNTPKDSDLYDNNQILKTMWFYRDDLFPVEPDKSQSFNILERRAEFSFSTLRVDNNEILKKSPFSKDDLNYIVPILWLYKIYDEYTSILTSDIDNNLENIKTFFNFFNPEHLLIFFKRNILLDNNSFDLETLSFLIILSSLSKVTSLLIDTRLFDKDDIYYTPKNFNLFGRLSVPDIKSLIQNYKLKPNSYLDYLKIIIPKYLYDDNLLEKITYEYENRDVEIKKYYLKNAFNIMQIIASSHFKSIMTHAGYYNDFTKGQEYHQRNKMRQKQQIQDKIKEAVPSNIYNEATMDATPTTTVGKDVITLGNKPSNISNTVMHSSVDLSLAKSLIQVISKGQKVKGFSDDQASSALELLKFKSSLTLNMQTDRLTLSDQPPLVISNSSQVGLVTGLLSNHNQLMSSHQRKSTDISMSNNEIVETLFSISVYQSLLQRMRHLEKRDYSEISISKEMAEEMTKAELAELKTKESEMQKPIGKLKHIASQTPKVSNVKSIKVNAHFHGEEEEFDKRVIGDCGKFAFVGLHGEPGKITRVIPGPGDLKSFIKGMPDASTLEPPISRYCEVPLISLGLHDSPNDNLEGGIHVEITYEDGTIELKNIASNQELMNIFGTKAEYIPDQGRVVNVGDLSDIIPVVEVILELNGLNPAKASLAFPSCRGNLNSLQQVTKDSPFLHDKLAINVDICGVVFDPVFSHEFVPHEVKRVILGEKKFLGDIITVTKPKIFDASNPKNVAGQMIEVRFKDNKNDGPDRFICWNKPRYSISMPYYLLKAFNDFLEHNPELLHMYNSFTIENRFKILNKLLLSKDLPVQVGFQAIDENHSGENLHKEMNFVSELQRKYPNVDLSHVHDGLKDDAPVGLLSDIGEVYVRNKRFRHPLEIIFPQLFQQVFEPPEKIEDALLVQIKRKINPDLNFKSMKLPNLGVFLRHQIEKLYKEENPKKGWFSWLTGGAPKGEELDKMANKIIVQLYDEIKIFYNEFKNYGINQIELDQLIIDEINRLNITDILKITKIQIEKVKLHFLNKKKRKINSTYLKFIYNYFYQVVHFQLLNTVNEYKLEIEKIKTKIAKAQRYFNVEKRNCMQDSLYEYKLYGYSYNSLEVNQKALIKEYYEVFKKIYSDKIIDNIESTNIIIVLKQLYETTLIDERFNYIYEKYSNVIDLIIIDRWAYYIILYDLDSSCDIEYEIELIEFELCRQKLNNTNILEPLTNFIPKYHDLIKLKKNYLDEAIKLFHLKNKNCDFLYHYFQIIDNKINDIYNNTVYIRNINNDINRFFFLNRIEDMDNEYGQKFRFNIFAYSYQLDCFLNNFYDTFSKGNELLLYNPFKKNDEKLVFNLFIKAKKKQFHYDNIFLENNREEFYIPDNILDLSFLKNSWIALSTENTIEYELKSLQKTYLNEYEKVKMEKFIEYMVK
jgi:hypothetical protein